MKKIYLLFCFIYLFNNTKAQSWCTPGSTWYYGLPQPATAYSKYTYLYDTLVGTVTCNKIKMEAHGFGMGGFPINETGYIYTFYQNGIVFKNNGTLAAPDYDTMYYFNGSVGDKWRCRQTDFGGSAVSCSQSYIEITDTGSTVVQGQSLKWRKIFYKNYYSYAAVMSSGTDTIFERIGTKGNIEFFSGAHCGEFTDGGPGHFRCFSDFQIDLHRTSQVCDYTTGIVEQAGTASQFSVINPCNETLSGNYPEDNYKLSLMDAKGKIVYTGTFTEPGFSISTSQLAEGIYILQVNGSKTNVSRKIVVKH